MKRATFILIASGTKASLAYAADTGHVASGIIPEFLTHGDTNTAFLAMVVFLMIVWRVGGFKAITSALDKRSEIIQSQLNEARDLREAATKILAEAERHQKQADKDAKAIVKQAKSDADALMAEARETLAQRLERREAIAEARIRQAESDAATQVRRAAAEAATQAAKAILIEKAGTDQFATAAREIETALN